MLYKESRPLVCVHAFFVYSSIGTAAMSGFPRQSVALDLLCAEQMVLQHTIVTITTRSIQLASQSKRNCLYKICIIMF